jgi:hypothetical protein
LVRSIAAPCVSSSCAPAPAHAGVEVPLDRAGREGLLRVDDFPEDPIVRRLPCRHLIIDLELPLENRVRRRVEADALPGLQLDVILRVAVNRLPRHIRRGRLDRVLDDGLHRVRQRVEPRLVEHDLELLGVLVVALQHADPGHVGEAEQAVGGRVVELGGVQRTAVDGRHDLLGGQRADHGAHALKEIDRDADGAELETLGADRFVEPAQQLPFAAVLVPG